MYQMTLYRTYGVGNNTIYSFPYLLIFNICFYIYLLTGFSIEYTYILFINLCIYRENI